MYIDLNGFLFNYQYHNKLTFSIVFKQDYSFDIKNTTVVKMPIN